MYYQAFDITNYNALLHPSFLRSPNMGAVLVYDSRVDELAIYDAVVTEEMDASGSFRFTMPTTHPYINQFDSVNKSAICVAEYNDDNSFKTMIFGGLLGEKDTDFLGNKVLTFYGLSIMLHNTPMNYKDYNGLKLMNVSNDIWNKMLNIYGQRVAYQYIFTFGTYEQWLVPPEMYSAQEMATDFLKRLSEAINASTLSGNPFNVHYYTKFSSTNSAFESVFVIGDYGSGTVSDQIVECGKNLLDYKETILDGDFFTGVIGYGAETDVEHYGRKERMYVPDDDYSYMDKIFYNSTLVATYGQKVGFKTWDDVTLSTTLASRCQSFISQMKLKKKLDCKVFDLSKITNVDRFDLGEIVIVRPPKGSAEAFLITKIERDLNDASQDNITLQNW